MAQPLLAAGSGHSLNPVPGTAGGVCGPGAGPLVSHVHTRQRVAALLWAGVCRAALSERTRPGLAATPTPPLPAWPCTAAGQDWVSNGPCRSPASPPQGLGTGQTCLLLGAPQLTGCLGLQVGCCLGSARLPVGGSEDHPGGAGPPSLRLAGTQGCGRRRVQERNPFIGPPG